MLEHSQLNNTLWNITKIEPNSFFIETEGLRSEIEKSMWYV